MRKLRILTTLVTLTIPVLTLYAGPAFAADGSSHRPDVVAALAAIRNDATAVAEGKYASHAALEAPARDIALQWDKVEPVLAADGDVLVETKMANASVASFEKDWQSKRDIRAEAKDLRASIGDLVDAENGKT
jgi:hypothetical protein